MGIRYMFVTMILVGVVGLLCSLKPRQKVIVERFPTHTKTIYDPPLQSRVYGIYVSEDPKTTTYLFKVPERFEKELPQPPADSEVEG